MKKEREYIDHIKESWCFSKEVTENELKLRDHIAADVAVSIFDKIVSPYHYFVDDKNVDDSPTEKQINYALKLGIENPETYTKKTLSEKIEEVKQ